MKALLTLATTLLALTASLVVVPHVNAETEPESGYVQYYDLRNPGPETVDFFKGRKGLKVSYFTCTMDIQAATTPVDQPGGLQNKLESSSFSKEKNLVEPLPRPNAQGDYTVSKRRVVHRQWQVVDPEGVNCRMPQQFQWKLLFDLSGRDPHSTIAEELLQDNKHNPLQWSVISVIKNGEVVNAFGGHLGALILLTDRRNKTWLPIVVKQANRYGNCFVRANQKFIRPVER